MRLEPLELWLELGPGPLRPQILAALRQQGEPLRWAITAVETSASAGPVLGGSQEPSRAPAPGPLVAQKGGAPAGLEDAPGDGDGRAHPGQKGTGLGRLRLEALMLR